MYSATSFIEIVFYYTAKTVVKQKTTLPEIPHPCVCLPRRHQDTKENPRENQEKQEFLFVSLRLCG
jgi:hypothetical protein